MTNTARGLLLTSIGALIMSFEGLLIKLTTVESFKVSFYLGIFIFISSAIILFKKYRYVIKDSFNSSFKMLLIASFLMASSNIFFISAIKSTLVANVVLILAAAPLFAAAFTFLLYKIKPSKNIFVASFFIFIGLAIIFYEQIGLGDIKGNVLALICAMFFSLFFTVLSNNTGLNRIFIICLAGLFLSIESFIFASDLKIDSNSLVIIAFMGLLIVPFSRLLIGTGTKFLNASEVSLLMIIETVMAPIWVWIIIKEVPSLNTFLGGALIIITLIINSLYTLKKSKSL